MKIEKIGVKARSNFVKVLLMSFFCLISSFLVIDQQAEATRDQIIPIVINFDQNYFDPAVVTISSMCAHANSGTFYHVFCLVSDTLPDESQVRFKNIIGNRYHNCEIEFKAMGNACANYGIFGGIRYNNQGTYYRLLIPQIVPNRYNRCLYLDTDVVVGQDLSELFNENLHGNLIGGIADRPRLGGDFGRDSYGLDRLRNHYINSGVILFDLQKCRQVGIVAKTTKLIDALTNMAQVSDQAILNRVYYNQIQDLAPKYNYMVLIIADDGGGLFTPQAMQEAINHPAVIHFAACPKPWFDPFVKGAKNWWQEAHNSPLWEEIRQKYLLPLPFDAQRMVNHLLTGAVNNGVPIRINQRALFIQNRRNDGLFADAPWPVGHDFIGTVINTQNDRHSVTLELEVFINGVTWEGGFLDPSRTKFAWFDARSVTPDNTWPREVNYLATIDQNNRGAGDGLFADLPWEYRSAYVGNAREMDGQQIKINQEWTTPDGVTWVSFNRAGRKLWLDQAGIRN